MIAVLSGLVVAYPFALAVSLIVTGRPRRSGRIPADVDLDQALATVRGIAYGCTCVNGPARGVLHRPDCPMTVQRRAHGYARGRV